MRGWLVLLLLLLAPLAGANNLSCALIEKRVTLEFVQVREQQRRHYAMFEFTNNSVRERKLAVRNTDPLEVSEPEARMQVRRTPTDAWEDASLDIGTFTTPFEWLVVDPTGRATLFYELNRSIFPQTQARLVLTDATHCTYRSDAFTVPARNT